MENRWHNYADTLNNSSGVAVTTSCSDIDGAFKFMNDLLDQEIHDLPSGALKVRITWLMKTACITAPKKCG